MRFTGREDLFWQPQNQLLDAYRQLSAPLNPPVQQAFADLADRLNISPELLGWKP
jgi:hypothetical protein